MEENKTTNIHKGPMSNIYIGLIFILYGAVVLLNQTFD